MKKSKYKNIPSIILENDFIYTEFLPSYGCKMVSLKNKKTDKEFLFQQNTDTLEVPPYGAPFNKYDSSGYDEVFPSIDRAPYPDGQYEGVIIPDHGEIWAMPWTISEESDYGFTATVKSKTLPYIFTRTIVLKNNEVHFNYTVKNTSLTEPFKFIWALHALLACSPKTKILTPDTLNQIMTVEHGTQTLGPWGTLHSYPLTTSVTGKTVDMSAVEPKEANNCEKFYFTAQNVDGVCGVLHADTGDKLTYKYDALQVPYLGVWKTQGGYRGDYNIALEPCTGVYDDIYTANKIKKISWVNPGGAYSWYLHMCVE
ncbi:galactose mutarotase-like enzyme [Elusimicrobium simillimum]|uniref:DUF5107 domain-containing protein n=1 Tax=Elusimicrobium simillimum TaxID=3143438 RepID=UPI003C6F385D